MALFGMGLGNNYPFFGFHGDMEEASKASFKTSIAFAITAVVCTLVLAVKSMREKSSGGEYSRVSN